MLMKRAASALLLSLLAAGAIGAPSAMAGGSTTRAVDDDGHATVSNCDASAPAKMKIQKAVDASSAGDTIRVCPGVYVEQIRIGPAKDGLQLRSSVAYAAIIRAPLSLDAGYPALLRIKPGADDVRVRGFTFQARAPEIVTTGGGSSCKLQAALSAEGFEALISYNRFRVLGPETLGPCGYSFGVQVVGTLDTGGGGGGAGPTGTPDPEITASARVVHNDLVDFQDGGIAIAEQAFGRVDANRLRYLHENYPAESPPPVTSSLSRPAPSAWGDVEPTGGKEPAFGIGALYLSSAWISDNDIRSGEHAQSSGPFVAATYSGRNVGPAGDDGGTPMLGAGVFVLFNSTGPPGPGVLVAPVNIVGNRTVRVSMGIQQLFNVDVHANGNQGVAGDFGMYLSDTFFADVDSNSLGANIIGIGIFPGEFGSSDNEFINNHALGNLDLDCLDLTEGKGTDGTANLWEDNTGNTDVPDEICEPYFAF